MLVKLYNYEYFNGSYHVNTYEEKYHIGTKKMNLKQIQLLNLDLRHNVLSEYDYFRVLLTDIPEHGQYIALYDNRFIVIHNE